MRHQKRINSLSRTSAHRSAMLSNMATSLIIHKRITTTVAKARALKKFVEPLITKAKNDTMHSRRVVFRHLQDKDAVNELFREISVKVADRPGGYTRILKTGFRKGDNAEMCIIELVDYNEAMLEAKEEKQASAKKKTRRSRRGSGSKAKTETQSQNKKADSDEQAREEQPKAEAKKDEAPENEEKKADNTTEDKKTDQEK